MLVLELSLFFPPLLRRLQYFLYFGGQNIFCSETSGFENRCEVRSKILNRTCIRIRGEGWRGCHGCSSLIYIIFKVRMPSVTSRGLTLDAFAFRCGTVQKLQLVPFGVWHDAGLLEPQDQRGSAVIKGEAPHTHPL